MAYPNEQMPQPSNLNFLGLPPEIRRRIYTLLFEQGMIQHNHKSALVRQRRSDSPHRQVWARPTFIPANKQKNLFAILLTCRQCYHEGLVLYYRHSTVKGLLSIQLVWLSVQLPYHALDEDFEIRGWHTFVDGSQRVRPPVMPARTTSNLSMVLEHSQHFVDDGPHPRFSVLHYAKAARIAEYQTANQFASPSRLIEHITLSRKQNIQRWDLSSSYLWRHLPRQTRSQCQGIWRDPCTKRPTKGLREGVFGRVGLEMSAYPDGTLESLEKALAEKPNVDFILTCPVLYLSDGQRRCAICDFDLRTEELVSRRLVTEDSMYNVGYFPP